MEYRNWLPQLIKNLFKLYNIAVILRTNKTSKLQNIVERCSSIYNIKPDDYSVYYGRCCGDRVKVHLPQKDVQNKKPNSNIF